MPMRSTPLVNGEYYHVYNRGVASQITYSVIKDYDRFLLSLSYYRFNNLPFKLSRFLQIPKGEREDVFLNITTTNDKLVELVAFCLMPNHFHILLQQRLKNGTSKFVKQIADSYTRFFNTKYDRVGPLFQGAFKAVHIENDEQLLHVSRYIHLNPLVSYVVKENDFLSYPWSSLKYFTSELTGIVDPQPILAHFKTRLDYLKFVQDQADYGKQLERIKHLTLEKS